MKYGLPKTAIEQIRGVFAHFPEIDKAVLYGSRAKGNYQAGSDIDLTLYGNALTPDLRDKIANALDDLLLPYTIDLSLFDELDHAKLREHIERVGVVFYERVSQGVGIGAGWETKTLGEVVAIEKKQHNGDKSLPYVGMEDIASDSGLFLGNLEPKNVKGGSFLFDHQHVLYGRLRPYLNKVLLPNFEGHCSTEVFPIKPNKDIDKRFLFFWLTHSETVKEIDATCTGTRMPRANMHDVLRFNFSYPPLPEQKRIVSILDEAFAGIATATANAKNNLVNAREVFESTLQSVFSINNSEGWQIKPLGDVCDVIGGGTPSKDKAHASFYTGDIRWATVRDMKTDLISVTEFRITPEAVKASATNIIPKGNVIIATRVGLGKVCRIKYDTAINQDLRGIVPKEAGSIIVPFLFWWMKSVAPVVVKEGRGATVQGVTLPFIKSLPIPLPPLPEQQRIIAKLDEVSAETIKLESIYQKKLITLDELKKSILNQAFSGQLQ